MAIGPQDKSSALGAGIRLPESRGPNGGTHAGDGRVAPVPVKVRLLNRNPTLGRSDKGFRLCPHCMDRLPFASEGAVGSR